MKIGVTIMPRNEVLDTQGRAVGKILEHHDFSVSSCRVGTFVELQMEGVSEEEGLARAKKIADFVLHNPLIEDYKLSVLKD